MHLAMSPLGRTMGGEVSESRSKTSSLTGRGARGSITVDTGEQQCRHTAEVSNVAPHFGRVAEDANLTRHYGPAHMTLGRIWSKPTVHRG